MPSSSSVSCFDSRARLCYGVQHFSCPNDWGDQRHAGQGKQDLFNFATLSDCTEASETCPLAADDPVIGMTDGTRQGRISAMRPARPLFFQPVIQWLVGPTVRRPG